MNATKKPTRYLAFACAFALAFSMMALAACSGSGSSSAASASSASASASSASASSASAGASSASASASASSAAAKFYVPGTGWVPADPADVLKAVLADKLDKTSKEALDKKEYYWGQWDEKRVEYSQGRDLQLSPAQQGAELNDFGYPYAEVDGQPVDYYKPKEFVYSISFK